MKIFLRWLPAVLMMLAIFLLSSIPSREMPSFGGWDLLVKKGGHALGYGTLALLVWHGLGWKRSKIWLAFLITILYALSDEFHQSFVAGRQSSLVDALLFDGGGGLLLLLSACWISKRRERR